MLKRKIELEKDRKSYNSTKIIKTFKLDRERGGRRRKRKKREKAQSNNKKVKILIYIHTMYNNYL